MAKRDMRNSLRELYVQASNLAALQRLLSFIVLLCLVATLCRPNQYSTLNGVCLATVVYLFAGPIKNRKQLINARIERLIQSDAVRDFTFGDIVECIFKQYGEFGPHSETFLVALLSTLNEVDTQTVQPLTHHQVQACNVLIAGTGYPELWQIRKSISEPLLDKIWFLGNSSTIPVLEEYISKQHKEQLRLKAQLALAKLRDRLGDTLLLREAIAPQIAVRSTDLLHGIHDGPRLTKVTNTEAGEVPTATEPRETGHHSAS